MIPTLNEAREAVCDLHWAYLEKYSDSPQVEDEQMHDAIIRAQQVYAVDLLERLECYGGPEGATMLGNIRVCSEVDAENKNLCSRCRELQRLRKLLT